MRFSMRPYRDESDYWRIRAFLREVFLLNGRRARSWDVVRFDYWRWHVALNIERFALADVLLLWESETGQIAAVLNPDNRGEAFFQLDPRLRTAQLEQALLDTAEQRLAAAPAPGRRALRVWAPADDPARQALLRERGYTRADWPEHQRRRPLDTPIPDPPLPPGYTVRALADGAELLERCYASGLAFHPDDLGYAVRNRADSRWYRNIQRAPLYRRDLDLVACAPDGAVAAFCTVWFDDTTRAGVFEPVGTVPAEQRRGLGRAVLCEGLRRLRQLGATVACVGSYSPEAGALYHAVGFTDYDLSEPWVREWS